MRNKWSDEDLILAVKDNKSIAGVIRALGLVPAGGNYQTINRKIECLGLNTKHMTGRGWNVNGFIPTPAKPLSDILIKGRPYQSNLLKKRLIKEGYKESRCERCLLDEWLEEPIPLELEHVDGDHDNNSIENLKILCPNCHAKTPTYRGKNKQGCVAQRLMREV